MKLGIIARADDTGVGNQTRELVTMLNPEKILLIDSTPLNGNAQHYEWYEGRNVIVSNGFPSNVTVHNFLAGIDAVLSVETFYKNSFVYMARKKRVKTFLQYNFEFLDYLSNDKLSLPDVLIAPSLWRIEEVRELVGNRCRVEHIPPPTTVETFASARVANSERSNRLLHIVGKAAVHDRNGTESVIKMLKYSKADYELVIKSQFDLGKISSDKRVKVEIGNTPKHEEMYRGYDAMILPRRYAGLSLPMNEALMSGMPVFMTDISPNNFILPQEWLAKSTKIGSFMTRTEIDIHSASPKDLARVVDEYLNQKDLSKDKAKAFEIGYDNFSPEKLHNIYNDLLNSFTIRPDKSAELEEKKQRLIEKKNAAAAERLRKREFNRLKKAERKKKPIDNPLSSNKITKEDRERILRELDK